MKTILLWMLMTWIGHTVIAQKYFTKNGEVSFTSKTSIETIHAENNQVLAVIDPSSKQVAFNLLVKGFLFEKQLMQDHFNEEVLESDKYPKASFVGRITDRIDLTNPGNYHVHITGQLRLHGIDKPLNAEAYLKISSGSLKGTCSFKITYTDYNIKMPSVLQNTISKTITTIVKVDCTPMNK